jgi:hypothetical protein
LDSICTENCLFQGNFSVKRNGVIDIYVDVDVKTAPDAPKFPDEPLAKRHVRHILAAQLFSFIRDIGHQHQHHNPKTDTIVDLHEIIDDDDTRWRKHTLYGIYRRIISYKRRPHVEQQLMALGLLAYAKAFRNVCVSEGIDCLPPYYDLETRESISATEARVRYSLQKRQDRISVIRTVGLGLAALVVAIAGLEKIGPTPNPSIAIAPELDFFARAVAGHPLAIVSIMASTLYFARVFFAGKQHPERGPVSRMFQSWLQPYSRSISIIFRIAVSFTLLASAFGLVAWRLTH